jgi:transcriptional regulator GlxA family with amidase domain
MESTTRNVNVLLFDDVEVLDFAGPFEVFGVTGKRGDTTPDAVHTVSEKGSVIRARNGLAVTPSHSFETAPHGDVLVVPGGFGTRREMKNERLLEWLRPRAEEAEIVLSVCTGALVLAAAGLLDGLEATTHHGSFDLLEQTNAGVRVRRDVRVVDNGHIITSAGISAGIDAALHVVARLHGQAVARETAEYMEYDWRRDGAAAVAMPGASLPPLS